MPCISALRTIKSYVITGKYNFCNYSKWGFLDTSQKTIGNMFQDAGYTTAYFGKWQLDNAGVAVKKFGFESYCVYDPFDNRTSGRASRYKNSVLYANESYIPDNLTAGKYGEDIFTDSILNFIERNKNNPFFIYYPMVLAHEPFQPTSDDADFAAWNSLKSDTSYYASMINYMDKKIGQIMDKVKDVGNTIVIYVRDKGTPKNIAQYVNDDSLTLGGKTVQKNPALMCH